MIAEAEVVSCYRCRGRGRCKLRRRARGRGYGGRYGTCPNCDGHGYRLHVPTPIFLQVPELQDPEMLKLFFCGDGQ